jgi:Transposase DDE domain
VVNNAWMRAWTLLTHNPTQVLQALDEGRLSGLCTAGEEETDQFLLFAQRCGLLATLGQTFPDPRKQCEVPAAAILLACVAAAFQQEYALCQAPLALHSARLLLEYGLNSAVLEPGGGFSRRGTQERGPFHGDVIRKLLDQLERQERTSGDPVGSRLQRWYNDHVGHAFVRAARAQPMLHLLDSTKLLVNRANGHYEGSSVLPAEKEQPPQRGYKLLTLRSLLDDGAVITEMALGSLTEADLTLSLPLLHDSAHLQPGDLLIEDRGFLCGKTLSWLKTERQVDVVIGLKADMQAFGLAVARAVCRPKRWEPHPTRPQQQIQTVGDVSGVWEHCTVPLQTVVVRERDPREPDGYRYWVFVSTRPSLSGRDLIKTYQLRPEIEEDYRQLKSPQWLMEEFTSTGWEQILFHVLIVLIAYNLFHVFTRTAGGREFAGKTRRQLRREARRSDVTYLIGYTASYFAVFETKRIVARMLRLPRDQRERLAQLLEEQNE